MHRAMKSVAAIAITTLMSMPAQAGGSAQHLSNALAHSMEAIAQSTVAGLKLVSGSVAIPLMIGGEIGKVSGQAGEELWEEANRPMGDPLIITDEVVTAGPTPAEAMQSKEEVEK